MPQPTALLRAPQEDLYMQFYGISFVHPYKQSGRWQDVLDAKVLRLAIDQTAYMGAWKKDHRTECADLSEDEHLDVRNMSKTL